MYKSILSLLVFISFQVYSQNYSLSFDGIDDYVNIPNDSICDFEGFTMMFYVKTQSSSAPRQEIISRDADPQPTGDWTSFIIDGKYGFQIRTGIYKAQLIQLLMLMTICGIL